MPEIHDLRSFINCLEDAGQLVRITRPVDLEYELADLAAALERRRRPAPLFEAVRGSDWPIFASAVASQASSVSFDQRPFADVGSPASATPEAPIRTQPITVTTANRRSAIFADSSNRPGSLTKHAPSYANCRANSIRMADFGRCREAAPG